MLSDPLLRRALRILVILVAALQSVVYWPAIDPDGIAYLDFSDHILEGDRAAFSNGYWSPGFPLLLSLIRLVVGTGPEHDALAMRVAVLISFLLALLAFEYLLRALRQTNAAVTGSFTVFAYSLFLWAAHNLNTLSNTRPDLLMSACVFAVAALVLQIERQPAGSTTRDFILIGLLLGVGYLFKAVMFVLGVVWLGLLAWRFGRQRQRPLAWMTLVFALIAAPMVAVLSARMNRFTFGETGRLNYAWYVNGVTTGAHWRGQEPGSGTPRHPTRLIFADPAAFEFASPVQGTYPVWSDPSYWTEGIRVRLDADRQVRVLASHVPHFLREIGPLLLLMLPLIVLQRRALRRRLTTINILIALIGIGFYMVVHLEARLIAGFVVLLVLCAAAVLVSAETSALRRASLLLVWAGSLYFGAEVAHAGWYGVSRYLNGDRPHGYMMPVLGALQQLGLEKGSAIASVGYTFDSPYARRGRFRIIAEVPASGRARFWEITPAARAALLQRFAASGARAVVTDQITDGCRAEGWQVVPGSHHCVRRLP